MTESDDPIGTGILSKPLTDLFKRPDPPDIQPGREIITDPNILDPQRKKKKQRAMRTVLTDDFAPPKLGNAGILGLESQVA